MRYDEKQGGRQDEESQISNILQQLIASDALDIKELSMLLSASKDNLKYLNNLQNLDLRKFTQITYQELIALILKCPNLTSVNFVLTDEELTILTENCKQLTSVNVSRSWELTDESVKKLTENCPNLTIVNFSSCFLLTNEGLIKLAKNCKELTKVNFSGCYNLTDEGLIKLAENCKELTNVDFSGCCNLTDEGINHLIINCPHLKLITTGKSLLNKTTLEGEALKQRREELMQRLPTHVANDPSDIVAVLAQQSGRSQD